MYYLFDIFQIKKEGWEQKTFNIFKPCYVERIQINNNILLTIINHEMISQTPFLYLTHLINIFCTSKSFFTCYEFWPSMS